MTKYISYFSHRIPLSLRMISVLILAGCALWLGIRSQVNYTKTVAPANPLPELSGQAAVEYLKQAGLYETLAEAMEAARYNADPQPAPDSYQFFNPAQSLRATFRSSGARITTSKGGPERELTFKLIGYGYGSRRTELYSRNIVARLNRIEHEYSLQKQSEIRNPKSEIVEWFVNSEAGIEHGFTLPEPAPAERDGDEALRVEMEIGGDYELRLDAAGQAVSFTCGRGGGELTYNKLRVYDAREREVAARFELDGKRLTIVVEDGEAEYPVTIDPLFAQQAKLTANDGAANDFFGASVAISGDTVVVGAPFATIDGRGGQGAAYIFVRNATTTPPSWTQQAKLTASDGAAFDLFGFSVAIAGDTVVVGAPPGAFEENFNQGAAYIFVRDARTPPPSWTQQAKLTASNGAGSELFGFSVTIAGDTVVVGDGHADIASNIDQGSAYIFVRDATTTPPWTQQAKLAASDGAAFDLFGISVAIAGDTVVVGAPNATIAQGAAYIFVRDATTTPPWTQQAKLTASDGAPFDGFGRSVAIAGDTVVVGAVVGIAPNLGRGAAYIFVRDAATPPSWSQHAKLAASDGEELAQFGLSVAIAGDTVVVGAPIATIDGRRAQGAAYIFVRDATTTPPSWTQQAKLTASDGAEFAFFGLSVAIAGDTVVVGARGDDRFRGAAYVFVTITPGAFVTVSAASYTFPVAPKQIVAGFGVSLAAKIAFASSLPLPTVLDGTSVIVKDSAGVARDAPLFFISPLQINYQIPDGTATGVATVSVFIGPHLVAVGPVQIENSAPSIFTLNASGSGAAAALDALTFAPAPFNAELADGEPNFIAVWGTGLGADATDGGGNVFASVKAFIDGEEAQVTYAGPAPGFQGSNQFNIQLPLGITSGEHKLTISRDNVTSNEVTIAIKRE